MVKTLLYSLDYKSISLSYILSLYIYFFLLVYEYYLELPRHKLIKAQTDKFMKFKKNSNTSCQKNKIIKHLHFHLDFCGSPCSPLSPLRESPSNNATKPNNI